MDSSGTLDSLGEGGRYVLVVKCDFDKVEVVCWALAILWRVLLLFLYKYGSPDIVEYAVTF
jgi:hypothetical protein